MLTLKNGTCISLVKQETVYVNSSDVITTLSTAYIKKLFKYLNLHNFLDEKIIYILDIFLMYWLSIKIIMNINIIFKHKKIYILVY